MCKSRCATLGLVVASVGLTVAASRTLYAQAQCRGPSVAAELFTGSAWNLPLPLIVELPAQSARIRAHYSTRPFSDAPYYSYRIVRSASSGRGIDVELLHHKLYLDNPAPPIERLEVTHGYNLATVNDVSPGIGWQWRLGAGLVIAHPEGRIAGRDIAGARTMLGSGYHVAGVTTQLALGRRYTLGRGQVALVASPEAKLTASWARIGLDPGALRVPNIALHALGGVGVRRCAAAS